ncbi:MAG: radical SAM protein [Planctomycetota bacterium]
MDQIATSTIADANLEPGRLFPFLVDHPKYDSPTKRDNFDRLMAARSAQRLIVEAAPVYLRFEPNAHCNLRCCWAQRNPRHPDLRPRGNATVELAKRIVSQLGDCLYQVILCHWGEPTLNRQLPELVRIFHDAGIYTTLDTNMTLMTAELATRLVTAGLDNISASIDGVSQESYSQYRIGGNVNRALAGLRHIVAQREKLGRQNPRLRWQFLVFPHNQHEVEAAEALAAEIGVDTLDIFGGSSRRWTRTQGFLSPEPAERPPGLLCEDPWTYLAIDWDGAVHLCCRAFQAQHVVGHMNEQSLREIFDNDRLQLTRRIIRDGVWQTTDAPTPCTGCNKVKAFAPAIAALNHRLTLE